MKPLEAVAMLVKLRDIAATKLDEDPDAAGFFRYCLNNFHHTKSQNFQDLFALYHVHGRKNGFFVEFGATNGIAFSNTHLLETRYDWNGILAEPARSCHSKLFENRNCFIDKRCVWRETGAEISFNETPNTDLSTIDEFSGSDWLANRRAAGVRYSVPTVSLDDLLSHHNAPRRIDYISVDTEGSELEILKHFDFNRYDVRVFTIEHNWSSTRDPILEIMRSHGFQRTFESLSGWDDWYVKRY